MRLELNNDLVGICINIPGGKNNSDYIKKISVKLENEEQEAYNE